MTTWRGRNQATLKELCEVAQEIGIEEPNIVDIGPGGSLPLVQMLRPSGDKPDWNVGQKSLHAAVKLLDSVLRKSGMFDRVVTTEPSDILEALDSLNPSALAVFDHNPAVVKATQHLIEKGALPESTSAHRHDFESSIPPVQGDIVIVFNVITRRAIDPQVFADSLGTTVRPGGLLALSHNKYGAVPSGFQQLREQVFFKEA